MTHIVKQLQKKRFLVSNMLAWEGATFRKAFVHFKIAGKSICSYKTYSKEFVDGASTHANLAENHFFVSKSAENPFFMREVFWFLKCTCFLRAQLPTSPLPASPEVGSKFTSNVALNLFNKEQQQFTTVHVKGLNRTYTALEWKNFLKTDEPVHPTHGSFVTSQDTSTRTCIYICTLHIHHRFPKS